MLQSQRQRIEKSQGQHCIWKCAVCTLSRSLGKKIIINTDELYFLSCFSALQMITIAASWTLITMTCDFTCTWAFWLENTWYLPPSPNLKVCYLKNMPQINRPSPKNKLLFAKRAGRKLQTDTTENKWLKTQSFELVTSLETCHSWLGTWLQSLDSYLWLAR